MGRAAVEPWGLGWEDAVLTGELRPENRQSQVPKGGWEASGPIACWAQARGLPPSAIIILARQVGDLRPQRKHQAPEE